VLLDEKRMLPCAAYLNGEYGVNDVYTGVPIILGHGGVKKIVEIKLSEEEQRDFERSVSSVRLSVEKLNL
ncbi:MAG: malate dehydrogenase, partial [Nitrospirae bacterium]|nr:malate dehydrogenase [Nitrospirota bacterium]